MADTIQSRLDAHGIVLPRPAAPAANYVPFGRVGNLLFISGQLPLKDGKLISTGLLGRDLDVAAEGAHQLRDVDAGANILAQVQAALGDLEQLKSVPRISVLVASTPDFTDQHLIGNGASDLLAAILGERGKHSRVAVGMASLPLNASVEVESIIEAK